MLLTPQDYGQESSLRDEITPPTSFSGEELEVAGKATASTGGSDLASVGKKVKQAYPGYSYMTDEQLGMKFLAKYGNKITSQGDLLITSQRFRDAGRNTADCLEKLRRLLLSVSVAPKRRRPTKPTRSSVERRLERKRRRSKKKRQRRLSEEA